MDSSQAPTGRYVVWASVCVLILLHQDSWWWSDRTLVFGILPVGLAYHAAFSLAAGLVWAFACKFAWPNEVEAWAEESPEGSHSGGAAQ
jgi:hypothetical protein